MLHKQTKMKRDTSSPYDIRACQKKMHAVLRQIRKLVQKKLSRFPPGGTQYFIAMKYSYEHGGSIRDDWATATSHCVLEAPVKDLTEEANRVLFNERARASIVEAKKKEMPRNAERRAALVRQFLRVLWSDHVDGTRFHGKKQMYVLVNEKGAPPFEWWDRVTGGVAFENTAVDVPEISDKIYGYFCRVHCDEFTLMTKIA